MNRRKYKRNDQRKVLSRMTKVKLHKQDEKKYTMLSKKEKDREERHESIKEGRG
jgi:hypothetical protein